MRRLLMAILLSLLVSAPLLAQATYANPRYGFSVALPAEFAPMTAPENGDGQAFQTADKEARLTVYGSNNIDEQTLAIALASKESGCPGRVIDRAQGENWYALSWVDSGRVSYLKCYVGRGSQNSMLIEYPASQKERFRPIVKKLAASFRPGDLSQSH